METYIPHVHCLLGNTALIATHVVTDTVIFLSYMVISSLLFVARRNEHLFTYLLGFLRRGAPDLHLSHALGRWGFISFATFIAACGFTHLFDIIVLWVPMYWMQAVVKTITAVASASTALLLIRVTIQYVAAARKASLTA